MVAPECCNYKRQCDQSSSPRPIHNIRRLQNRLGCVVREPHCKRLFTTESGLSCHQSLSQGQDQHCGLSPHGQQHSCSPRQQQRGNAFPTAFQSNSRTMVVVSPKISPDHCSTFTRQPQQCSGQRVQQVLRLQRVANRPTGNPTLHNRMQCRPLCLAPNSSPSNLCQLETRPGASYTDAMTLDWASLKGYAFPPLSLIAPILKKISQVNADLVLVAPVWQAQPWWPLLLNLLVLQPNHDPELQILAEGPCMPSQNPSNVPQAPFSRLSRMREQHQAEGFIRIQYQNTSFSHLYLHT